MLQPRLKRAARLMFILSDEDVAREMDVTVDKVEEWRARPDVRIELVRLHREFKAAAARFASRRVCEAALRLGDLIEKGDAKILLDTLKAAGAFAYEDREGQDAAFDAMIQEVASPDEDEQEL